MKAEDEKPLYQQIKSDIERRIVSAELPSGSELPTRSEIAAQYKTTKATVDRAMQELVRSGMVSGGSGRRRTVMTPQPRPATSARSVAVVWSAPEEHITRAGDDFFGPLISGIRHACSEFMIEVHFRAAQLNAYTEVMTETGAQGLLVLRPDYSEVASLERLSEANVPIVTVPGILEAGHIASISSDNFMGMAQAVEHLSALGHRDIALVSLTGTVPDHYERLQGFLKAMGQRDLPVNPRWLCLAHAIHTDDFARLCRDWLDSVPQPSAIIASDFLMGLALLRGLNERNLRVPEDISLVNFDDPRAASYITPPLTCVRQSIDRLAYRGVQRLVQMIQKEEIPFVDRIPTEFIVRDSTARPRS